MNSFRVEYDPAADVLYINKSRSPAERAVEDQAGIVWRYDRKGEAIGVTVLDFHEMWSDRSNQLASELARHFSIPLRQAALVLEDARAQQ